MSLSHNVRAVLSLHMRPLSKVALFEFTASVCSPWTQLLLRESVCHLRQIATAIESSGEIQLSAVMQVLEILYLKWCVFRYCFCCNINCFYF